MILDIIFESFFTGREYVVHGRSKVFYDSSKKDEEIGKAQRGMEV